MSDEELTQDEINQLITGIDAVDNTEFPAEVIRKLEVAKQRHDEFYKRKTAILTQDEINQLLTAINADDGAELKNAVPAQDKIGQLFTAINDGDIAEVKKILKH
jgi:flagellar motor switch protein FliM